MLTKTSLIYSGLLVLLLSLNSFAAESKESPARQGYSFFGLGFDVLDYEENTTRKIDGKTIDIETASGINLTQQSGAYVSINDDWGFYLVTASTLGDSNSDEEWQIDDITVRTNKVAFERQRLGFLASQRISSTGFFLFGAQYNKTEFKRFAAKLTPQAIDFGIDDSSFSAGTVSENVWDLSLVAGYESNTIFTSKESGWRHQMQLVAGVPLFTSITNTDVNEGESFSKSFNGFQLRFNGFYGYQFDPNMILAVGLELGISQRNSISRDFTDTSGVTEFPESNLLYLYPSLVALWSF